MLILIAGPYRSGTNDDPARMAANLHRLEAAALPLLRLAGSTQPGDAAYQEILYPAAHRLLAACEAVLRLGGASAGADEDVRLAQARGLPVYFRLEDVPGCAAPAAAALPG